MVFMLSYRSHKRHIKACLPLQNSENWKQLPNEPLKHVDFYTLLAESDNLTSINLANLEDITWYDMNIDVSL